jgi:hypothetical protein
MKYGQNFEKESVPEWSLRKSPINEGTHQDSETAIADHSNPATSTDNIDYNSLKHHIKVHTTRDQATAISIPGHQDNALAKFEDELFLELCRQHDRVDLFVTSKASELSRRLRTNTTK